VNYTGKPYDVVTGLYDYGYRDYSPALARFTTVDPIRDNRFVYVNNDPVNYIDLWGLKDSNGIAPIVRGVPGASPAYPQGYITYSNSTRQTVSPYTGQTLPRAEAHFPLGD
jgi:RHS repeat-associated protein